MKKLIFMIENMVLFLMVIGAGLLLSNPMLASASEETFVGIGEYVFDMTESIQSAQEMALQEAKRQVSQQAAIAVKNKSESKDSVLSEDEVIMTTASVMKIQSEKYNLTQVDKNFMKMTATITATIDMDKAEEMTRAYLKEKTVK